MIPAEIALRQHEAEQARLERAYVEPSDEDREQALTELTDKLVEGGTVDGWTLAGIIDCEQDASVGPAFGQQLATVLNLFADNASGSALWLRVMAWQRGLVKKWLPEELIEERAEEIAKRGME